MSANGNMEIFDLSNNQLAGHMGATGDFSVTKMIILKLNGN